MFSTSIVNKLTKIIVKHNLTSFVSFRHWGGTKIAYYSNGNMLIVKRMLRHKAIQSSMKYVGQINFDDSEFETATATIAEEAQKLAEAGYNKFDEFNGIHIYKRSQRFKVDS